MPQTEAELEQKLIERLTGLGYEPVTLRNAEDLKAQLEKHNKAQLEKYNKTLLATKNLSKSSTTSTKATSLIAPNVCAKT